jgi:hypothetical protein
LWKFWWKPLMHLLGVKQDFEWGNVSTGTKLPA